MAATTDHTDKITNFILSLGLVGDQIERIHKAVESSDDYAVEILGALFPTNSYRPASSDYSVLNTHYYGTRANLQPSIIFTPETVDQVASGVRVAEFFKKSFAVRGGGHTPFPGGSSVNNGILFSLSKMNEINLDTSKKVVSLGPGNRWGRVYETLEKHNVIVSGGEYHEVGVAGLLLGNGISQFTSSRGFSSADVRNYQIVVGGGQILNANKDENSDLWWALKGGVNNFGIVTRFDMETFPLPGGKIWGGARDYEGSKMDQICDAYYDVQTQSMPLDATLDVAMGLFLQPAHSISTMTVTALKYGDDISQSQPAALKTFVDLEPFADATKIQLLSSLASIDPFDTEQMDSRRINRGSIVIKADRDLYHKIFNTYKSTYENSTIQGHMAILAGNPITTHSMQETVKKGGNAGGWETTDQLILSAYSYWTKAEDDVLATTMDAEFFEKISQIAQEQNALMPNLWANQAGRDQKVIESYGRENIARMREISSKYDPNQTFQKLCSGNYKLW